MGILSEIFTMNGRISRIPYSRDMLILWFFALIVGQVFDFIMENNGLNLILLMIMWGLLLSTSVGGFMLSVRRLHDMNKRGWFMFIMIIPYALEIPYAYIFFQLYLCLAPGTVGSNRYGEDPLL